jgi:hypothetical protein
VRSDKAGSKCGEASKTRWTPELLGQGGQLVLVPGAVQQLVAEVPTQPPQGR